VAFLQTGFRISERRAAHVIQIERSSLRYRSTARDQTALRMRLRDLAAARVRYGYRRLHVLLRREGWRVNHKRVFRLYRLEGLGLRLKHRRKRVSAVRVVAPPATKPNERWAMDFMTDSLYDGRRFRMLTLVDTATRECPTIEVGQSLTGQQVVAVLNRLKATRDLPRVISVDNGPEFISKALDAWAHEHGVQLEFSRPGTPTDNPYIEAFNGRLREECLDQHWFASLEDARRTIEGWRQDYNTQRPHGALGNLTPQAYAAGWTTGMDGQLWKGLTQQLEGTGSRRNRVS
jgi:putative transposase